MNNSNSQSAIKFLAIVFYVIVGIVTVASIISWYWVSVYGAFMEMSSSAKVNMKSLIVVVTLAGIPLSFKFHQKKISHIVNTIKDHGLRISQYKMVILMKYAMLEALAFIGLFGYLLSGDLSFLLISAILVVTIVINYPSIVKMEEELEINDEKEVE